MASRGHLVVSRTNSSLRVAGMPEQRSNPALAPDLFNIKDRAARRGLKTHIRGVFRSAERSPFMSPQRPTARDFKSCGATTSMTDPLDKTFNICCGKWTNTASWSLLMSCSPTVGRVNSSPFKVTFMRPAEVGIISTSEMPDRILTIFLWDWADLVVTAIGTRLDP